PTNRIRGFSSYSDGSQCPMIRPPDHPGPCPFHSREERQALESERIGTELAAPLTGHFYTATDINHVLGKVFTALAQDRISIKKAKALCYAAQLMLATLPNVRREFKFKYDFEAWQRMLDKATHLPDPEPIDNDPWQSADNYRAVDAHNDDIAGANSDAADTNVGARYIVPSSLQGTTASDEPSADRHSPNGQRSATNEFHDDPELEPA